MRWPRALPAALAGALTAASALSGCPFDGPACDGPAASRVELEGQPCDGCIVDFGQVDVPLQAHRRIDIVEGCGEEFFETPVLDGDSFALSQFQFPQQPGGSGFAEVSFTASQAGDATGTFTLDTSRQSLVVTLQGSGVTP